jgi:predicted sulfurtransferase
VQRLITGLCRPANLTFHLLHFLLEKAPSLKQFGGTHLEADEYHEAMKDPEAVIIDVRNAYESAM